MTKKQTSYNLSMEMENVILNQSTLTTTDDYQMELLIDVLRNNCRKLNSLLQKNVCDINHVYGIPFCKTALEIACFELAFQTSERCIKILLKHGANAESAFSCAALGGNPKILKVLLQHLQKNQVDITNNTVVISVINYVNSEEKSEENYAECIRIILQSGVDVNATEIKTTCTAINLAAKYNLKLIIAAILSTRFDKVNLDNCIDKEFGSARDMIIMRQLYDDILPKPIYSHVQEINTPLVTLVQYIKQRNDMKFIAQHRIMKAENLIDGHADYVLLVCATEEGSLNVVRYLLCVGVDPNSCNSWNKVTPIRQAALRGYYEILEVLIRYSNTQNISDAFVALLQAVCLDHKCIEILNINHKRCCDLLLKSNKLDVNFKKGKLANPALHFAIKNQTPDIVMKILRRGASLALLRLSNKPWTVFVSPEVLQTHLDECVIVSRMNEFTNDFTLIIDFTSLLPVQSNGNETELSYKNEYLECDSFLSDCEEHNLIFSDTKVLDYIATKIEYKTVLQHPVIHVFLYLKSLNIRRFFYLDILIYLIFITTLMAYIFLGYNHNLGVPQEISLYFCLPVLVTGLLCFAIREMVQLYIFRYDYFKHYENFHEIMLLIIIAITLSVQFENAVLFKQLSALAIVFSAMELLLMIGRQTTILFTSLTMLTTVSLTLFKLLLPYLILISAFAISFFILFKGDKNSNGETIEFNLFDNAWTSLLKTTVMLTGEFEAGDLNFLPNPFVSPLLFILFVFHMNIVLFGVFTALAISDTQKIKAEAETQRQIMRINHISYWEKVIKMNKCIARLPMMKTIFRSYSQIEIYLTKDSKLYSNHIVRETKTEIKIDAKIISAMKSLVVNKNNISSPAFKKCPILRYPILKDRDYFVIHKQIRHNND